METDEESEKVTINLSYPFEYPTVFMTQHVKPLYIKAYFDGIEMGRVLVDKGAAVNLLPRSSLKKLGKRNPKLIPTSTTITSFAGDKQMAQGILPINLSLGTRDCMTAFFVINNFTEAKLYTEGVVPLSVLRKSNVTAEVIDDEEVAHLKHLEEEALRTDFAYEEESKDIELKKIEAERNERLLRRSLVEYKLPVKPNFKPHKQKPRWMSPEVVQKAKKEIVRLLKVDFIRTVRYVKWLSNIVLVVKNNGELRVCINFRNLSLVTSKDEYPMFITDLLVESSAGHKILSMMDRHSRYNQICIAEEDVHKIAFKCLGNIDTFE
ncbi:uncharacterized protein LOC114302088 [Camellia sinensis]|uniref:uncharacterized protein LOC114302088 n=1 Tax=Camellia sinensis TaxID=4442 RepID=UPI001035A364|nr:uncharacterized protein LOC114302088 [Camellia sinensis]